MTVGLHIVLDKPEIPGNTGNIIRLAAVTGFQLHIAGPTLFDFSDAKLKRAGLDYHDLAVLTEHQDLETTYAALGIPGAAEPNADAPEDGAAPNGADHLTASQARTPAATSPRVFAFTGEGQTRHTEIDYRPGDVLLFGRESTGLDEPAKADPRITALVRIPMLPGRRSLNLANSVSIAVYEAWRQRSFHGAG